MAAGGKAAACTHDPDDWLIELQASMQQQWQQQQQLHQRLCQQLLMRAQLVPASASYPLACSSMRPAMPSCRPSNHHSHHV